MKYDIRFLLSTTVDLKYVVNYLSNRECSTIHDIDVEKLISAVQDDDYFPDFNEKNAIPEDCKVSLDACRSYFSIPRSRIILMCSDSPGFPKSVYTPSEFIKHWNGILLRKEKIIKVFAERVCLMDWVYKLEPADRTPIDVQLRAINNDGFNCNWKLIDENLGMYQHCISNHRVQFQKVI